ncbi:MAG: laccase domain-containing protein, partial [Devosia sp.]
MSMPFETSRALERLSGVRHGFFGRRGGHSTGDFASLNASESVGDKPGQVQKNREKITGILGFSPDALAQVKQVHSARVVVLTDPAAVAARPEADAIVTDLR